jgi:hypothetical protein
MPATCPAHLILLYFITCINCCKIWGFQGGGDSRRGSWVVTPCSICGWIPQFRRNLVPPSSGRREDRDRKVFRNVGILP